MSINLLCQTTCGRYGRRFAITMVCIEPLKPHITEVCLVILLGDRADPSAKSCTTSPSRRLSSRLGHCSSLGLLGRCSKNLGRSGGAGVPKVGPRFERILADDEVKHPVERAGPFLGPRENKGKQPCCAPEGYQNFAARCSC